MFVKKILENILGKDEKIFIPSWAKKVKIDVGTSLSAPNSEVWLSRENNLVVFGFEPNIYNIEILHKGQNFWPYHIKKERIGYSFFCINCALSNTISEKEKFYCTGNNNSGTSSLYEPKTFEVLDIIEIPVLTLKSFFDLFPWDKIPYIDQLKIDAQSSDFNIIKGCGEYLSQKIVYIDVETSTNGQYFSNENSYLIKKYLEDNGFECLSWGINATFVNIKYKNVLNTINYFILGD